MKKTGYLFSVLFLALVLIQGCNKGGGDKQKMEIAPGEIIKYAKFATSVYKDQELKTWAATLSKTEPVKLVETVNVQIKGKAVEVSKVKLSDNTIVFVNAKNIGDKPVVFIEDTKAYVRNNASSKVYVTIPKGTIGFVIQENADWIQVYIGQLEGKWVTQQWVNSGFSADNAKVQEAKLYEESAAILKNSASKPDQIKQAQANLKDLSNTTGIFAEMAKTLLNPEGTQDAGSDMNAADGDTTDGQKAEVQAAAGLTMREEPGTSGKSILIIPNGSTVKVIEKGTTEETISGKTAFWYKVDWNGKKGWVFGGFLAF